MQPSLKTSWLSPLRLATRRMPDFLVEWSSWMTSAIGRCSSSPANGIVRASLRGTVFEVPSPTATCVTRHSAVVSVIIMLPALSFLFLRLPLFLLRPFHVLLVRLLLAPRFLPVFLLRLALLFPVIPARHEVSAAVVVP